MYIIYILGGDLTETFVSVTHRYLVNKPLQAAGMSADNVRG